MVQVQIQALSKKFEQDIFAKNNENRLVDISHTFPENKSTAIIGHNGAGKTTLLRIILGFTLPSSGRVLFSGEPLNPCKHIIGYMPESARLPLKLTPKELLKGQLQLFRPELDISKVQVLVEACLNKVGMEKHQNKWIEKLSKGQTRRIAWAFANIHSPNILVLDEPFSGFDPKGQDDFMHWLNEVKILGQTVFMSSHDLDFVFSFCDEILVLKRGHIALYKVKEKNHSSWFDKEEVLATFTGEV